MRPERMTHPGRGALDILNTIKEGFSAVRACGFMAN
jgi:hypothetical protein